MRTLAVFAAMISACLAMAHLWRGPWVWPALALCLALMLVASGQRLDVRLFWLGVGVGAAIDLCQSAAGVTVYRARGLLGLMPPFALLYWGMGVVALRRLVALCPPRRFEVADGVLLVSALSLSLVANHAPMAVSGAMAASWLLARRFARADVALALGLAGAGTALEATLVAGGLYHFPSALGPGVPLWLPVLYAGIGAGARGLFAGCQGWLSPARTGKSLSAAASPGESSDREA